MTTGESTIERSSGPGDGLPLRLADAGDCWNRIGVNGDRSCPELTSFVHCRNCPVFARPRGRSSTAPRPRGISPSGPDGWPTPTASVRTATRTPTATWRMAASSPSERGSAS